MIANAHASIDGDCHPFYDSTNFHRFKARTFALCGACLGVEPHASDLATTRLPFTAAERASRADTRRGDADAWHWCDSLTTDYCNPPTSESQHARQRVLVVILAFVLAAIQAGW